MANTQAPFGFRSFGHQDGASPTMGLERRFINSTDANTYFTGDPVQGSSGTPGFITIPATQSVRMLGIFAGCEFYSPSVGRMVWSPYYPGVQTGSTMTPIAYVITDPDMQFLAQTSTTGSAIGQTSVGLNICPLGAQSSLGNTTTGISFVTLASSTVGANSSFPFRIVDLYSNFAPSGVNGTDNASVGNILVVVPNNWDRKSLTGVTT